MERIPHCLNQMKNYQLSNPQTKLIREAIDVFMQTRCLNEAERSELHKLFYMFESNSKKSFAVCDY